MATESALLREKYQNLNIEDEEFIPFMFRGYETKYKISKYGNVFGKRGQILKWFTSNKKSDLRRKGGYASVGITIPRGSMNDGYIWRNKNV